MFGHAHTILQMRSATAQCLNYCPSCCFILLGWIEDEAPLNSFPTNVESKLD